MSDPVKFEWQGVTYETAPGTAGCSGCEFWSALMRDACHASDSAYQCWAGAPVIWVKSEPAEHQKPWFKNGGWKLEAEQPLPRLSTKRVQYLYAGETEASGCIEQPECHVPHGIWAWREAPAQPAEPAVPPAWQRAQEKLNQVLSPPPEKVVSMPAPTPATFEHSGGVYVATPYTGAAASQCKNCALETKAQACGYSDRVLDCGGRDVRCESSPDVARFVWTWMGPTDEAAALPDDEEPTTAAESSKPTNPKDVIGVRKAPLSCVPMNVVAEIGVGMLEGAAKYGRHNYRAVGVRASVYFDAAMRHMIAWWEGEDLDPDTGVSHVSKTLACLAVLRDAQLQGLCTDDRPPRSVPFYPALNEQSAAVLDRHAGKDPRHYTIEDSKQ